MTTARKRRGELANASTERKNVPANTRRLVLTEAGYRCAVPTCRSILALELHHLHEVSRGGGNDPTNLIALCPNCHALVHNGIVSQESVYAYKAMLVAISRAYDLDAVDRLLFLEKYNEDFLVVSGDGALHFARLVAGGLASVTQKANNEWQIVTYSVNLTERGRLLIQAWKSGDQSRLKEVVGGPLPRSDQP